MGGVVDVRYAGSAIPGTTVAFSIIAGRGWRDIVGDRDRLMRRSRGCGAELALRPFPKLRCHRAVQIQEDAVEAAFATASQMIRRCARSGVIDGRLGLAPGGDRQHNFASFALGESR